MRKTLAAAQRISAAVAALLATWSALAVGPALAADSPLGKWSTVDDKTGKVKSEVQLYDQGGKLYGKIVGLPGPTDAQGKPKVCLKCQGPDKDQPIVGLVIIKDLAADGERFKGGTILDPEDGKVYKADADLDEGEVASHAVAAQIA